MALLTCGLFAALISKMSATSAGLEPPQLSSNDWYVVISVACLQSIEMSCQFKAMEYLKVSEVTMVQSLTVFIQSVVSCLWGVESLNPTKLCSATFFTFGGILQGVSMFRAAGREFEIDALLAGLPIFFISLIAMAHRYTYLHYLCCWSPPGSAMYNMLKSPWFMLQVTMPVCALFCMIISVSHEIPCMQFRTVPWSPLVCRVAIVAFGLLVVNYTEVTVVRKTMSAVPVAIIVCIENVVTSIAAVKVLHEKVQVLAIVGFLICLAAAGLYIYNILEEGLEDSRRQRSLFGNSRSRLFSTRATL